MNTWVEPILATLTAACDHYEKTAPTVHAWADDLFQRIEGSPADVCLPELLFVPTLREPEWMQPNHAANAVYHLMARLGQSTVGHAGY